MTTIDIGRRKIIAALGGALAAWPAVSESKRPGDVDADLARVQTARRIVIKGGAVPTVDRRIGALLSPMPKQPKPQPSSGEGNGAPRGAFYL